MAAHLLPQALYVPGRQIRAVRDPDRAVLHRVNGVLGLDRLVIDAAILPSRAVYPADGRQRTVFDDHAFVMVSELRSFVLGAFHAPAEAADGYQDNHDQRHGRNRSTDQQSPPSFLLSYFLATLFFAARFALSHPFSIPLV